MINNSLQYTLFIGCSLGVQEKLHGVVYSSAFFSHRGIYYNSFFKTLRCNRQRKPSMGMGTFNLSFFSTLSVTEGYKIDFEKQFILHTHTEDWPRGLVVMTLFFLWGEPGWVVVRDTRFTRPVPAVSCTPLVVVVASCYFRRTGESRPAVLSGQL